MIHTKFKRMEITMNHYEIENANGKPDWNKIHTLEVSDILWLPDAGIRMTQQICYDEQKLYIHQIAVESQIRAEHTELLAQVCEDSCMEFFFCPEADSDRYFNFEWNFKGALYLGWRTGRDQAVRLQLKDHKSLFNFHSIKTQDGWEIFYEIPVSFVQLFVPEFKLQPGKEIRANCYKCGDLTPKPHYLSWNPSTSANPDFHRPHDFGAMILG